MSKAESCPLMYDSRFMSEEDIPYECRSCLDLTLDSELGWSNGEVIGVPHEADSDQSINQGNPDCDHDMYYWQTSIKRGEAARRIIDIAADCDECHNFRSYTYIAVCKTEN